MKCTSCREEIKPVVAIDIDGTMGQYHYHFLRFAADYLGEPVSTGYEGQIFFKQWFKTTYRVDNNVWHDIKLAYRQGGMKRTMAPYNDARKLCDAIRHTGAELWVTTTRPYIRHDNIDPDTRHWLERHSIMYDYLLYDGHKYAKLAQLVGRQRVCAVLDDLPEEIMEARDLFGTDVPVWRKNEWNGAWRACPTISISELVSAKNVILSQIELWKEKNATR
jgi:hypothetical protein